MKILQLLDFLSDFGYFSNGVNFDWLQLSHYSHSFFLQNFQRQDIHSVLYENDVRVVLQQLLSYFLQICLFPVCYLFELQRLYKVGWQLNGWRNQNHPRIYEGGTHVLTHNIFSGDVAFKGPRKC